MRPNIKQMKERIEFLDHQLDLEIAHWKHAEEEIEALEGQKEALNKEMDRLLLSNYELKEEIRNYQEEIVSLKSSLNDGKYIKNLGVALKQIQNQKNTIDLQTQTLNEQAIEIAQLKKVKDAMMSAMAERPQGTHFCSFCGERAYIYRIEDKSKNSKCYCDYCFKKLVIKFEDKA